MPLLWLLLSFLFGILLASIVHLPVIAWTLLALCGLLLFLVRGLFRSGLAALSARFNGCPPKLFSVSFPLPLAILTFVLCLGALRYQLSVPDLSDPGRIAFYAGRGEAGLTGILIAPPDRHDTYTSLRIQVEQIRPSGSTGFKKVHGIILAWVPPGSRWNYGDRLELQGELLVPPVSEDFSYQDYLAHQGIYAYLPKCEVQRLEQGQGNPALAVLLAFRQRALIILNRLFPEPEAALMSGILLGEENRIPPSVKDAFNRTGTAHIIAISGFNITILAGLFTWIFARLLGRWKGALVSAGVIALYTILVGANPSVVRAAIMGGFSIFAVQLGRRQDGLNSLALVAALMALFNPQVLWDVSFQLSFAATLGLVWYATPFTESVIKLASRSLAPEPARKVGGWVGEYFLFTLAAQLVTLPVIVYHFRQFSWIAFLANPLVLPVQPAVMVLSGIAMLAGMLYLPLGQMLAYLSWPFVAYTIRMVEWLAAAPIGVFTLGRVSLVFVAGYYGLLLWLTFARRSLAGLVCRLRPAALISALGILAILVWKVALAAPDGRLHLILLDTNTANRSGEAVLIQTPAGRFVLIGGGPSALALNDSLGRWLPLFDRRLDWLVVAGTQDNQLSGLSGLASRVNVDHVLWGGNDELTRNASALQAELKSAGVPIVAAEVGQELDLGDGARLRVAEIGEKGASIILEYQNFRAWLPLGLDWKAAEALTRDPSLTAVNVYLLAGRGAGWVNPPELLHRLRPQAVLLSVASGDLSGLPQPETLKALQGYTLLRTDLNGWVHLRTDGIRLWVEVERK